MFGRETQTAKPWTAPAAPFTLAPRLQLVTAARPLPGPHLTRRGRHRSPGRATATVAVLTAVAAALAWSAQPALAEDVERSLALTELRLGDDIHPLTVDYMQEIVAGLQKEPHPDVVVVPMAKSAEKLRRDRDQVPGTLTLERRNALDAARKAGISFLDNADAASAIKALQQAEGKYRAAIASPGADERVRKDYLDVLAQLATAHVIARDKEAAADVFRTVVTAFGPKANVTDDNYRPDVVELFHRVAKEVAAQGKGQIELQSEPVGAHVLIGGIDRGTTPLTVTDLAPGTYALRLQAGPATSLLHRVRVTGGNKAKLQINVEYERHLLLDDAHLGLGYPDLEATQRRVLADSVVLGRELGVTSIAAIGVLDGTLHAWLVDVQLARIERSSATKVPGIGTSPRAVTKVLATLLGERRAAGSGEGAPAHSGPWYTSVPGIVCGAAALGALGVGAAFAPQFAKGGDLTQQEADKVYTGRTIAAVSLGAGGLLAVASGYLFWRHAQSGAATPAAEASTRALPPPQLGQAPLVFAGSP